MTIMLYQNASPPNYVNKDIQYIEIIEGVLRTPASMTDPAISIVRDSPTGFNYAHIAEYGRYYFVTGISTITDKLLSVSLHVDVLMTYKDAIADMQAIIKRQENKYNLYLDDGIFKAYQNTKHKIIGFPNGFNSYSYILAIAGNSQSDS